MADLSPAEIMLDRLAPAQRLIRRLQAIQKAQPSHKGIRLSPEAEAERAAFVDAVQHDIDTLIAQREKAVALIKRISDPDAQMVIMFRYGLIGPSCEKMPYPKICERMHYGNETIFRYRKKGIDQLNRILKDQGISFDEICGNNNI